MAYCTLEDLSGSIEVLVFPRVLEQYREFIQQDQVVLMQGRLNAQEETMKFFAEEVVPLGAKAETEASALSPAELQALAKEAGKQLYLRLTTEHASEAMLKRIQTILTRYPGAYPVYFYLADEKKMRLAEQRFWINDDNRLLQELAMLLGLENINLKTALAHN